MRVPVKPDLCGVRETWIEVVRVPVRKEGSFELMSRSDHTKDPTKLKALEGGKRLAENAVKNRPAQSWSPLETREGFIYRRGESRSSDRTIAQPNQPSHRRVTAESMRSQAQHGGANRVIDRLSQKHSTPPSQNVSGLSTVVFWARNLWILLLM